ncbi:alpha/beta fold hydrolase [Brevibacillus sp. NRS-1366]|uniref:alpha/beta fold hydrolase n=1 Tax=Brevibacillus sp. NRS-1366 TaxID=3233899 RepID=UPI003D1D4F11
MEQRLVQFNGEQLACKLSGKGTPVVCIHAPCIGSLNFSYQNALSDQFQLIVPDLPGHGESSSFGGHLSIGDLADLLDNLIQSLGIQRPFLLGYSQGASIALEYCLRNPDSVQGAILVSAFSEVKDLYLHCRFFMAQTMSALRGIPLLARSIASSHLDDQTMRTAWVQHASQTDAICLGSLYSAGHQYNCTDRLNELRMPFLLVYGKEDRQLRPYAELLDTHISHAKMIQVPNVHHQVITRAASTFNQLCRDFIQQTTK